MLSLVDVRKWFLIAVLVAAAGWATYWLALETWCTVYGILYY